MQSFELWAVIDRPYSGSIRIYSQRYGLCAVIDRAYSGPPPTDVNPAIGYTFSLNETTEITRSIHPHDSIMVLVINLGFAERPE
jgi:hypothetical protein